MADTEVKDEGDLRRYRTEIPNMLDDSDLSVYAFRLYVHLKRVAGDKGRCYQGSRQIAKQCQMSPTSVVKAKHELEQKGFIQVTPGDSATSTPDTITVVNVWRDNFDRYSTRSNREHPAPIESTPAPTVDTPCSNREHPAPVVEQKKEPPKKELEEERTQDNDSIPACAERLLALYSQIIKPVENLHINTRRAWQTLIRVRLQEGWTEAQLAKAFKGCSLDDWKDRWKWNKVTDILKDRDSIEQFINYADEMPKRASENGKTATQPKSSYGKPPVTRDFTKYPPRTG